MKRILLLACLFCISISFAQAQITLNLSDLAAPTQSFNFRSDTAVDPSITPGNAGANQTWDFHMLHDSWKILPLDIVNPATIPTHGLFSSANAATVYDSSVIIYFFNRSASALVLHGTVYDFLKTGDSIAVALSIPDTILDLPGIYGNTATRYSFGDTKSRSHYMYDTNYYGTPVSVPIDTIRIKHAQHKTDDLDAWGTITTPHNTFEALRQNTITYGNDSIWGYANVPAPFQSFSAWYFLLSRNDTTKVYSWWTKNLGIPVVKFVMASATSNQVASAEFVYDYQSGINEHEVLNSAVYPNPANDFISITNVSGYHQLVIYDVIGNEISKQNIGNSDIVTVSVQHLTNGLYFYNAINGNSKSSGKFIVKH